MKTTFTQSKDIATFTCDKQEKVTVRKRKRDAKASTPMKDNRPIVLVMLSQQAQAAAIKATKYAC